MFSPEAEGLVFFTGLGRSLMPLAVKIWKQVYNTEQGAGTEEKFIQIVSSYKAIT